MRKLRLPIAALLVAAAFGIAAPKAEAACPIYQQCMVQYPEGYCLCEGFYCDGRFICGIPRD